MLSYLIRRLLGMIPTLLIVVVIVFLFVHMLPGDPARLVAGQDADQVTIKPVSYTHLTLPTNREV